MHKIWFYLEQEFVSGNSLDRHDEQGENIQEIILVFYILIDSKKY